MAPTVVDPNVKPGEYVAQTLFLEFIAMAEKKIGAVAQEPIEKSLTKSLQRGEDPQFDQLLNALCGVSEHCLPSVLRASFRWYDEQNKQLYLLMQHKAQALNAKTDPNRPNPRTVPEQQRPERDYLLEKRGLAVDFLFCLVLIEILKQLPLHPGHDDLIQHIIQLSFKQFCYKDLMQLGLNASNVHTIADLFAEVLGVLAQSRFHIVKKKFMEELSQLRAKEGTPLAAQHLIALLMGMKFFRVKMVPIEEFEICMNFLHELATYFIEVKDREVKHALAGLFVEILLPVAASAKTEVNVPAVKNFVDLLYPHALDYAAKKKHSLAFFPLLTCLLCISQRPFFLSNWHPFLHMCLSNLKHKDPKMSRVGLESLYRLVWVYVMRIKCESNSNTQGRLQSICNSLFPKGGRGVVPRDTPLNIFVKILHFIAQERLDFAFKEVIFDLLCVGRPIRTIYPERMNIGLRALLVIADSLQQRDGAPPMPRTIGVLPSGNTMRVKRTYLTKPLTSDVARAIGIDVYYGPCRRAFDGILRTLDMQVGRPLLTTVVQASGKEAEDLLGGERKPKLDLFRTCIAAIPRVLPETMTHQDVIDMLARLTVHMDEELPALAYQTFQNLIVECPEWREDIFHGLLQFIVKELPDSCSHLLDNALKMILQLLCCWRNMLPVSVYSSARRDSSSVILGDAANSNKSTPPQVRVAPLLRPDGKALVLHCLEGLALVMLCQSRLSTRKLAVAVLKEAKQMLPLLCHDEVYERPVIDVLDSACAYVLEKYIPHMSSSEKATWLPHFDFLSAAEKIPAIEGGQSLLVSVEEGNEYMQWDAWACALSGFTEPQYLLHQCPTAVAYAWQAVYSRMANVFTYVDPNNPQNDTRASLLRSSKSKATSTIHGESSNYSNYLSLWQKYLVFACAVAPPPLSGASVLVRSVSPLTLQTSSETGETRPSELRIPRVANVSASNLFRQILPLLRCEMTDMRDIVVLGLGSISPSSFECLLDELSSFLREAAERRQENVRRKKRRDYLRLQLIRLLEIAVFRGTVSNANLVDAESRLLKPVLLDFIENARAYLDQDHDREQALVQALHVHFSKFVATLVSSFPVEKRSRLLSNETRKNLFYLFGANTWSGRLCLVMDRKYTPNRDNVSSSEYFAVSAMCAMLTCGPVFDSNAIGDDTFKGYIYDWLNDLIECQNERVISLSEDTLVLLLEYNSEVANLLDWVIDKCFTSSAKVADKCLRSLVSVFSAREYPCDYVSMFNLTLMYSGYPVIEIQCLAIELLQILDQRFFGDTSISYAAAVDESGRSVSDLDSGSKLVDLTSSGELLDVGFSKSQISLSEQLAALRPEMTMPIFSEISQRLQTAKPARRSAMLRYLLPWMHNIELVDPNLESSDSNLTLSLSAKINEANALARRILKGEGWGSPQATEMILNNLLYLTVKYGNEHANLVEALWAGLITYWPNNLRVITRYLGVMVTLSPEILLPYAKRIVIYMARVNPERLVDEMMNELQIIDAFRCPLERSEMAPYYRWVRRSDEAASAPVESTRGVIHTRRHTPSEAEAPQTAVSDVLFDDTIDPNVDPSASMASLVTLKPEVLNNNTTASSIAEEGQEVVQVVHRKKHADPFQLPMPAYGGYYCPLNDYLPKSDSPVVILHRSYLGIVLITDLVLADVDIEWTIHLPLMLHVAVLGLDHSRVLVHDSCKQILINLILAHSSNCLPTRDVTRVLVARSLGSQLSLATRQSLDTASTGSSSGDKFGSVSSRGSEAVSSIPESSVTSSASNAIALQTRVRSYSHLLERDCVVSRFGSAAEMAICISDFLAAKKGSPLWAFEDITARNWRIASSEQLTNFVSHLSRLYSEMLPKARTETRWAQTALHVALCCSNRHYAGRSFQVLRALRIPLTSRMLSDILSRLVETVCEQGEDMQGYVTEIMLTLDSSVLHMEVAEHSLAGIVKDRIGDQSAFGMQQRTGANNRQSPTHQRSTSYQISNNAFGKRGAAGGSDRRSGNLEWRSLDGVDESVNANLPRSKSAHALKTIGEGQDEHMTALSQLLWIAVSLLESDYEHEFLLALRLLEKLVDLSPNERQDLIDRLDRMIKQINWTSFSGLMHLMLKGCTFANTYEATVQLLTKMTPLLSLPAIDTAQQKGFALAVTAMMPYLILHYEDPTKLCIAAAENIAEACKVELERINFQQNQAQKTEQHPLEHLGTVMRLYSKRTFSKECMQWSKCVVKYLSDTYPTTVPQLLVILTEILDRGPTVVHSAVLQLLYCVFHHIDLSITSPVAINGDCLKVVSRHIQSPHWRDAARILKLAVTRSSSLSSPCTVGDGASADVDAQRKELPGRVMEFNIDMAILSAVSSTPATADGSPKRQLTPAEGSTWKKPWINQLKVREHLVCLLNASGLRVGLPKSPSVIFSQSSHDIAGEPSSVYSSSGELTIGNERASTPSLECNKTDVTSDTYAPVFKEFDFLDGEQDSMSESAESCFNWLSTMRPRSISSTDDDRMAKSIGSETAINCPSDEGQPEMQRSDSSDDEESTTSQAEEDSGETLLSADIDNFFNHQEQESQADERVPTPASISVCGSIGTPATEYSSASQWPLFSLECSHHATGQVDEAWSSLVSQVVADSIGSTTANATIVFTQLYQEACSRMCSLVRDSCHFLSMSQSFRDVSTQFGEALSVLMRLAECPFVFVTPGMLIGDGLLQRQKYFILELREHYDSFLERREYTIKCLNSVKSTLKLQLMGQKLEEQSTVEQEVELCRSLQKLFFQLLSMCETYTKMVEFLKNRAEQGQNRNLSEDVAVLHRDLLCAVGELSSGSDSQPVHDVVGPPQYRLQQMLQQRDYKLALAQLRSVRNHHNRNEMYGCCDEVDVEFLLLMYCQLTAENRSACFALVGSDLTLSDNCNQLMEANINISTTVRTLVEFIRKSNTNEDRIAEV